MTNRTALIVIAMLGVTVVGEASLLASRYAGRIAARTAQPDEVAAASTPPAACIKHLTGCRRACQYDFDTNPAAESEACFVGCEVAFQRCWQAG